MPVDQSEGLTVRVFYDDDLSDGLGLDSVAGISIKKSDGAGNFNVSVSECLTQLAQPKQSGGVGMTFNGDACGKAVLKVSSTDLLFAKIYDAGGALVFEGLIHNHAAASPNSLAYWRCVDFQASDSHSTGVVNRYDFVTSQGIIQTALLQADKRVVATMQGGLGFKEYSHDANGNVVKVRDGNGVGVDVVIDGLGRQKKITSTHGEYVEEFFDKEGNIVASTDPIGNSVTRKFDAVGREIEVIDRAQNSTKYVYDAKSNLSEYIDESGSVTKYEYDSVGMRTKITLPDHVPGTTSGSLGFGIRNYEYDELNRLVYYELQTGDSVRLTYDFLGRKIRKDFRKKINSPDGAVTYTDDFSYDQDFRLLSGVSGEFGNRIEFEYNDVGQLKKEILEISDGASNLFFETSLGYGSDGRLDKITYPDGDEVSHSYSSFGKISSVSLNGSVLSTRTYDLGGRLTQEVFGNSVNRSFEYRDDANGKDDSISALEFAKLNVVTDRMTYSYDTNGNETGVVRTGAMSGYGWQKVGAAGFDQEDNILSWEFTNQTEQKEWTYSSNNNRISEKAGGSTINFVFNDVNELTAVGALSQQYDVCGNLTLDKDGTPFSWNFENRLVKAGAGADETEFEYDVLGRLVAKQRSGARELFVWLENQMICEYSSSNSFASPSKSLFYGTQIDELIAFSDGNDLYYFHQDKTLSVHAVSDDAGDIVEQVVYSPHGEHLVLDASGTTVIQNSTIGNDRFYVGKKYLEDFHVSYFLNRWYMPNSRQFMSRDPSEYVDGSSLYRGYFAPFSTDPLGLDKGRIPPGLTPKELRAWIKIFRAQRLAILLADRKRLERPGPNIFVLFDLVLTITKNAIVVQRLDSLISELEVQLEKVKKAEKKKWGCDKSLIDEAHEWFEVSRYPADAAVKKKSKIGEDEWNRQCCKVHHVATWNNDQKWTPAFNELFKRLGIKIDLKKYKNNLCLVCDIGDGRMHVGPHPDKYHYAVLDLLIKEANRTVHHPDLPLQDAIDLMLKRLCVYMNLPDSPIRTSVTCKRLGKSCTKCVPGTRGK